MLLSPVTIHLGYEIYFYFLYDLHIFFFSRAVNETQ